MKINNSLSNLNYDINLENNNKSEINKTNSLVKVLKSEFYLDIKNDFTLRTSSGYLDSKEINEKIDTLKNIKRLLDEKLLPKYDKPLSMSIIDPNEMVVSKLSISEQKAGYLSSISDYEIKEERDKLIPFLNPNQKFVTREEKNSFISRFQSLDVNLSLLSREENRILHENISKAQKKDFDTFDKRNDFDTVISLVYFEKKKIESENSLLLNRDYLFDSNHNKSSLSDISSISERISNTFKNDKTSESPTDNMNISDQIEKINQIEEKILLASEKTTTLKEKESLIKDIKNLLKGFDIDFMKGIFSHLDNIMKKNNSEFSELTTTNIEISSSYEAKKYLANIEKLDINFDSLSDEEKIIYIRNKENIVNNLISTDFMVDNIKENIENKSEGKTFSEINNDLSNILQKELEKENDDIKKLIGWSSVSYSVNEAVEFLDILERRGTEISRLSEVEKSSFENSRILAKQTIRLNKDHANHIQKDIFIKNIDNFIYILNDLKDTEKVDNDYRKNINYKKESLSFSSQNITEQNGSFLLSQSLNAKLTSNVKVLS